jgi:hypothetical protein
MPQVNRITVLTTTNVKRNEKVDVNQINLKVWKRLKSDEEGEGLDANRKNWNLSITGQNMVVIMPRIGLRRKKLNRVQKVSGRMDNVQNMEAQGMNRSYRVMIMIYKKVSEKNKISQNHTRSVNKIKKSLKMMVLLTVIQ